MSSRTKNPPQSTNVLFVPLGKLKKSPKNVRKVPHTKADINALAASIAAVGMLQYPIVEPEIGPRGKPTGVYLVNAGEGRGESTGSTRGRRRDRSAPGLPQRGPVQK